MRANARLVADDASECRTEPFDLVERDEACREACEGLVDVAKSCSLA